MRVLPLLLRKGRITFMVVRPFLLRRVGLEPVGRAIRADVERGSGGEHQDARIAGSAGRVGDRRMRVLPLLTQEPDHLLGGPAFFVRRVGLEQSVSEIENGSNK